MEIRRVPKNWKHPVDEEEDYIPLYANYEKRAQEWVQNLKKFEQEKASNNGMHPNEWSINYFWEYIMPPEKENFVDYEGKTLDHYQVYETVTEGTPLSPVFETEIEARKWAQSRANKEKVYRNEHNSIIMFWWAYVDWMSCKIC